MWREKIALWLKYGIEEKNHLNLSLHLEKELLWDTSLHWTSIYSVFKRDTPLISHAENKIFNVYLVPWNPEKVPVFCVFYLLCLFEVHGDVQ